MIPGESRLAYRTGFERTAWGDVVWRGRFADGDPGYAGITLSIHGGVLVGSLQTPEGRAYVLEPRASGDWELRTEEASSFVCDVGRERPAERAKAVEAPIEPQPAADGLVTANDETSREVGILVVYTPAAHRTSTSGTARGPAFHNVDRLNRCVDQQRHRRPAPSVGVEEFHLPRPDFSSQHRVSHTPRPRRMRASNPFAERGPTWCRW